MNASQLIARKKRVEKEYSLLKNKLNKLEKEALLIFRQLDMMDRKGHKVIVKQETWGKGKNKRTGMVGRHYWREKFIDEDTGNGIWVERSRIVSVDGEYFEN